MILTKKDNRDLREAVAYYITVIRSRMNGCYDNMRDYNKDCDDLKRFTSLLWRLTK